MRMDVERWFIWRLGVWGWSVSTRSLKGLEKLFNHSPKYYIPSNIIDSKVYLMVRSSFKLQRVTDIFLDIVWSNYYIDKFHLEKLDINQEFKVIILKPFSDFYDVLLIINRENFYVCTYACLLLIHLKAFERFQVTLSICIAHTLD